jgi:hypothetical protein
MDTPSGLNDSQRSQRAKGFAQAKEIKATFLNTWSDIERLRDDAKSGLHGEEFQKAFVRKRHLQTFWRV